MAFVKQEVKAGDIMDPEWGNHVQTQYEEAIKDITKQSPWEEITLKNGFQNIGTGYLSASAMKDTLGFVHIFARVGNGTNGSGIMGNVPLKYRPKQSEPGVYMGQDQSGVKSISDCVVYTGGDIQLWAHKDNVNIIRISYYVGL